MNRTLKQCAVAVVAAAFLTAAPGELATRALAEFTVRTTPSSSVLPLINVPINPSAAGGIGLGEQAPITPGLPVEQAPLANVEGAVAQDAAKAAVEGARAADSVPSSPARAQEEPAAAQMSRVAEGFSKDENLSVITDPGKAAGSAATADALDRVFQNSRHVSRTVVTPVGGSWTRGVGRKLAGLTRWVAPAAITLAAAVPALAGDGSNWTNIPKADGGYNPAGVMGVLVGAMTIVSAVLSFIFSADLPGHDLSKRRILWVLANIGILLAAVSAGAFLTAVAPATPVALALVVPGALAAIGAVVHLASDRDFRWLQVASGLGWLASGLAFMPMIFTLAAAGSVGLAWLAGGLSLIAVLLALGHLENPFHTGVLWPGSWVFPLLGSIAAVLFIPTQALVHQGFWLSSGDPDLALRISAGLGWFIGITAAVGALLSTVFFVRRFEGLPEGTWVGANIAAFLAATAATAFVLAAAPAPLAIAALAVPGALGWLGSLVHMASNAESRGLQVLSGLGWLGMALAAVPWIFLLAPASMGLALLALAIAYIAGAMALGHLMPGEE